MRIIGICYTYFHTETQTVAPTLPVFQGLKHCIKFLASHPHKNIFYPSNSYYGSNAIRLTWSRNQVEDYTAQNFLECYQDSYHDTIINSRRSVSGIIHTLIGVAFCYRVHIQPPVAYEFTNG